MAIMIMEGRHSSIVVFMIALVLMSAVMPLSLHAQEAVEDEEIEEVSVWNREFIGLQVKTWAVIVLLVVVVFVILEGLGWIIAVAAVGYLLWLLLR